MNKEQLEALESELRAKLEAEIREELEEEFEEKAKELAHNFERERLREAIAREREHFGEVPTSRQARNIIDAEDNLIRFEDPDRYAEMVACGQASW